MENIKGENNNCIQRKQNNFVENRKVNKLFKIYLYRQHYWTKWTRAKVICDNISVLARNMNRNTKLGWEIRLEGQFKKTCDYKRKG